MPKGADKMGVASLADPSDKVDGSELEEAKKEVGAEPKGEEETPVLIKLCAEFAGMLFLS